MNETTKIVAIEETPWFDAEKTEPGQPGVFEVDPCITDDFGNEVPCFAYWGGRSFGPICNNVNAAHFERFSVPVTPGVVTKFRGLSEQA